jgi:hypothetical protein
MVTRPEDSRRTGPFPDLGHEAWSRLETVLARFQQALRAGQRPALEDFLGQADDSDRAVLLAELVHEDLEHRLKAGEAVRVETYWRRHPQLREDRAAALELILAECALRKRLDPHWTPQEYLRRFPAYREELEARLGERPADPPLPEVSDAGRSAPPRPPLPMLGEYELLERLGAGGTGEVYKARHRRLDHEVALKLLSDRSRPSPESVALFLRQRKVLSRLDHPNLVLAHDAGEEAGVVYLVMKLVEGEDLGRRVRRRGPLPVAEACDLARQAALGLGYLHERGLAHRDVKPSSLMRTAEGTAVVLDLGPARCQTGDPADGNRTGPTSGTPDYLAPEVLRGAPADTRSDLYGLGATLFYLLTGQAPNAGREAPGAEVLPEVPAELSAVVARLLARRPEDRFATAAQAAQALAPFAAGRTGPPATTPAAGSSRRRGWARRVLAAVWPGAFGR